MEQPPVITIDGPAGAGKSTLGERLARRLGYLYFDTGVMYRALALAVIERGLDPADVPAVIALAHQIRIDVAPPGDQQDGRQYTVLLDGHDVTWALREPRVDRVVSPVAQIPEVRSMLRARQRTIGLRGRVVMVGRDIGTVVMPDAPLKVYLTASLDERAQRRMRQLASQGTMLDEHSVRSEIARRDQLDRSVMDPAPDACTLSSDDHDPDTLVAQVLTLWKQRGHA